MRTGDSDIIGDPVLTGGIHVCTIDFNSCLYIGDNKKSTNTMTNTAN